MRFDIGVNYILMKVWMAVFAVIFSLCWVNQFAGYHLVVDETIFVRAVNSRKNVLGLFSAPEQVNISADHYSGWSPGRSVPGGTRSKFKETLLWNSEEELMLYWASPFRIRLNCSVHGWLQQWRLVANAIWLVVLLLIDMQKSLKSEFWLLHIGAWPGHDNTP